MQARAMAPAWKLDRQTRDSDQRSGRGGKKRDTTMTLSKVLATSAVVGLMGTAAFANEINFSQSGGSVGAVKFTQTGTGNMISSDGTSATAPATVIGSLATLKMEQLGSGNSSSFAITPGKGTGAQLGNVALMLKGTDNTSSLTVNQAAAGTLAFAMGVEGDGNSVTANITAKASVVNIEGSGDDIAYTIGQTGGAENTNDHSITASVLKTGVGAATVVMNQSGADNTILMGAPAAYGAFGGTAGLTLNGIASVSITQSAALASYTATQTVADNGSITVLQN